jgi:hypothetical protein
MYKKLVVNRDNLLYGSVNDYSGVYKSNDFFICKTKLLCHHYQIDLVLNVPYDASMIKWVDLKTTPDYELNF